MDYRNRFGEENSFAPLLIDGAWDEGILLFDQKERLFCTTPPSSHHVAELVADLLESNVPTAIFVGIGPGSYTGIRNIAALARSLSYGLNIPLFPISTLPAFLPFKEEKAMCALWIDAKEENVYYLLCTAYQDRIEVIESCICTIHEAILKSKLYNVQNYTPQKKFKELIDNHLEKESFDIKISDCSYNRRILYHLALTAYLNDRSLPLEEEFPLLYLHNRFVKS